MAKLVWDKEGQRNFEIGVDRGVIYPISGSTVAWNGLISVDENPTGKESTPLYNDGVKYLNENTPHEYSANITAFTYPPALEYATGLGNNGYGLLYDEQPSLEFGLSYRTMLGNDTQGVDRGYRIHIVYGVTATPKDSSNVTIGSTLTPMNFQWTIVGTPQVLSGRRPMAHVILDSTILKGFRLEELERILYGTSSTNGRLPLPLELVAISQYGNTLEIVPAPTTGFGKLVYYPRTKNDLNGDVDKGLYSKSTGSRLQTTSKPGLFTLGV